MKRDYLKHLGFTKHLPTSLFMSKIELQKATKVEMGYTEERRTCQFCIFKKPIETGVYREFRDECTYSNLCRFEVHDHGSCKYFQPLTKQQ